MKNYITISGVILLAAVIIASEKVSAKWTQPTNSKHYPWTVACSADGKTVYLVLKSTGEWGDGKLMKSIDGGQTWSDIQP